MLQLEILSCGYGPFTTVHCCGIDAAKILILEPHLLLTDASYGNSGREAA